MSTNDPEICEMETILNHVVLPERLPSRQETHIRELEAALIEAVLHAAQTLIETAPATQFSTWTNVRSVVLAAKELNNALGGLERVTLLDCLRKMQAGSFLIVYVRE